MIITISKVVDGGNDDDDEAILGATHQKKRTAATQNWRTMTGEIEGPHARQSMSLSFSVIQRW